MIPATTWSLINWTTRSDLFAYPTITDLDGSFSCMRNLMTILSILWMLGCSKESSESLISLPDHIVAGEMFNAPGRTIRYTKIEPVPRLLADNYLDLPIYDTYLVDINRDGRDDFQLVRSRAFGEGFDSLRIELHPLDDNQILVIDAASDWVQAVPILDTIHERSDWIESSGILFNTYISQRDTTSLGHWRNLSPVYYAGVKTKVDEQWLYGWIRMAVAQSWGDNLAIFDYATTVPMN